ncbi:polyribonucleotide nucleotidyltransferase 1-like isoform X1 [Leptotrombidium deliense]|uniref:polyribonucleotide nucleotidyltransferase n=1 Tax=Leptotrombidium deliense TaxID=299467 RepID=A0A443S4N3_9ACAR|nr:polyribonucleotide nucleotidyltransferase 1-like isoform X1 [Leptotrombidium deliense]
MALTAQSHLKLFDRILCNFCLRKLYSKTVHEVEVELSKGRVFKLNIGKLARLADGCCVASSGNTNVMATAVSKATSFPNASFMPLTVDFRQKSSATGKIPSNFFRRDVGTSEREILTSRMIDRSIRPLFPAGYYGDTQVVCNLLSFDSHHDPDVLAINAASAALALSDIPWNGPVGAVRVGYVDKEIIINPTRKEMLLSTVNVVLTGTHNKCFIMIDGSCNEPILLPDMLKILNTGLKETATIIKNIESLRNSFGKQKRVEKYLVPTDEQIDIVKSIAETRLREILTNYEHDKFSRDNELSIVREDVITKLKENFVDSELIVLTEAYNKALKSIYEDLVFESNIRCDGRTPSQLRDINCEVNLLKPLHGSALFQRGQTQVLCSLTLDSIDSALKTDAISALIGGVKEKNFMLHYDFPSFATNEIGRTAVVGRREIGHGALAEKALRAVVPQNFPFTIRLNCEVLESNGSSSMASVCAGSLALLDAGVNIVPAAGVAMGLISRKVDNKDGEQDSPTTEYKVLTDILGFEDYLGDMDFKIAGTKKGFTAIQLDTKVQNGLPMKVVMDAFNGAANAKKEILSLMNSVIGKPNEQKQLSWPVIEKIEIPPHKRSKFIGFSGHNLKRMVDQIGVRINADDEFENTFVVFAPNKEAMEEANEFISKLIADEVTEPQLDFGGIYTAKIVEIKDNGVMIELYPNMRPTLLHLKELDQRKVGHPSALGLEVGQEIQVKYFGRDPVSGYMRISRRVLQITTARAQNLIQTKE